MEDLTNGSSCGGYTNKFQYIAGPAYNPSSHFGAQMNGFSFSEVSDSEFVMEGSFTDGDTWIGTHSF